MDIPDEENVRSIQDLVEYIGLLARLAEEGAIRIENPKTSDYLEASGRWLSASMRYAVHQGQSIPEQPDWKFVASLMSAGIVYE